ncbi:MAG: hypothetical protein WCE94_02940 [Candidatus Methanoperedens sp.]
MCHPAHQFCPPGQCSQVATGGDRSCSRMHGVASQESGRIQTGFTLTGGAGPERDLISSDFYLPGFMNDRARAERGASPASAGAQV